MNTESSQSFRRRSGSWIVTLTASAWIAIGAGCGPAATPRTVDAAVPIPVDAGAIDVRIVIDAPIPDALMFDADGDGGSCTGLDLTGCLCASVGATRSCYTGPASTEGVGECRDGSQTCAEQGEFAVWGPCSGDQTPTAEMCSSGGDYNCNGLIGCDDPACGSTVGCCAPGATRSCYDGAPGTAGVGICKAGLQVCTPESTWGATCPGEIVPGSEVGHCGDGLDNDCNGKVDCLDPACATLADCCVPGATRSCYDGPPGTSGKGICMPGMQTCSALGTWPVTCDGEVLPGTETGNCSDGLDNDCNGFVDCLDPACSAGTECCVPGASRTCYDGPAGTAGVGICMAGQQICSAQGLWPVACAGEVLPGTEAGNCSDGLDNDCNGTVDCLDPSCSTQTACCVPGALRSCYTGPIGTAGVGICMSGQQVCTAQGLWPNTCPGEVLPGTEFGHCGDGLDNDCNGEVDCLDPSCSGGAGCCAPGASRSCYDGPAGTVGVGICLAGQQVCTSQGTWPASCGGEVLPGTETGHCSDGIDNDCNGKTDCADPACSAVLGCCMPGVTRSCYDGPPGTEGIGVCAAGTQTCTLNGTWPTACPGEMLPGSESGACSDGLDNDCNGLTDCADAVCNGTPECCVPMVVGPTGDVTVHITADNAYSFGYSDADTDTIPVGQFVQGTRATLAGQIFNCTTTEPNANAGPEIYTVPNAEAPVGAYLYIVTWDDEAVTQGVLGQFYRGGTPLYTGDPRFQVCATGLDYSGNVTIPANAGTASLGPTLDVINQQIAICDAGTGSPATTSEGWVNSTVAVTPGAQGTLAIGEANNDPSGDFGEACTTESNSSADLNTIDGAAQWMWYRPAGFTGDPFRASNPPANTFRAFLIFRLPADVIGCPGVPTGGESPNSTPLTP